MTPIRPLTSHARLAVACLATLSLALAACGSANPTASPTASVNSSTGAEPSASMAASVTHSAIVSQAPSASPAPAASPAAASQPKTIHLILHPSSDTNVHVGSLTGCTDVTPCQGDYRIGNDPLFDAATGKQVGTLVYVEFAVATGTNLFYSPADTITLTGRGQIVFTETIYDDGTGRPVTGAIIGGTDEFLGATGYVTSTSLPNKGDFVITITG
jgi:hypothetical protein